jgi:DNA primase large subunit
LVEDRDPPHMVRIDFVSELMFLGFNQEQVFHVIRELKWSDFNVKTTRTQIKQIYERKYLPPSCLKLKDFVSCSSCGWFYFWGDVLNSPNQRWNCEDSRKSIG